MILPLQTPITIATPSGLLTMKEGGLATTFLRSSIRSHEQVAAAVNTVVGLSSPMFPRCTSSLENSDGFQITWNVGPVTRLADLVTSWRANPAENLPVTLELVNRISHAFGELDGLRPVRFMLSPAQVYLSREESGHGRWIVLPLPLEGAGLNDFLQASEDSCAWLSGDELLRPALADRAYLLGAALYYCLVGDLFPPEIDRNERLRRRLMYRGGTEAKVRRVFGDVMPPSIKEQGQDLGALILNLLGPTYGRSLTSAQAALELDRLNREYSAPVLAALWEDAGNDKCAITILDAYANSTPKNDVSWEVVARLRAKMGNTKGAEEAYQNLPKTPMEETATFIARVRQIAKGGAEHRPDLERLVAKFCRGIPYPPPIREGMLASSCTAEPQPNPVLTDEGYLYLAYVNGRWLGHIEESLRLLQREFPVSWHKVIQATLLARLSLDRSNWKDVTQGCREGRKMIGKLPDSGGDRGRYLRGYLDAIDGIAHVQAVEGGFSADYLNDALTKLQRAWFELEESDDLEVKDALAAWLRRLANQASRYPDLLSLRLSLDIFCQALDSQSKRSTAASSVVPWFRDERLFVD